MFKSILSISAAAGVAAVLYNQYPLDSKSQTYCYTSLTTLSAEVPENANCFTVARDGTLSKVFSSSTEDNVIKGHVIPGLWDGHGHLLMYGEMLNSVNLFGAQSLEEVRARIKGYMSVHPEAGTEKEWIRGVGWDQAAYGRMPVAVRIDRSSSTLNMSLLIAV